MVHSSDEEELRVRVAAKLLTILLLSSAAWAADPFIGTWQFDKAKSKMGSSDFQARTFVITGTDRKQHVLQKDVLPDGTARDFERDEILDGQEHPAEQEGTVMIAKRVNANTRTFTWTQGGKTVRTATDTVSADGKTLTHDVHDLVRNENRVWIFHRE